MKRSSALHWILCWLTLSLSSNLYAQTKTVTGTVTGTKGEPLHNASVSVKGLTRGTTTDEAGKFTITVDNNNQVLVITYAGYAAREYPVGNQSVIEVSMSQVATDLNDVVVIGYGTAKRKEVAGAVVSVNPTTAGANTAINPAALIIGKAAGVQVLQGNGSPGSTPQIIIRGTGSFTRVDPLYVIDGIQSTRDMFAAIPPQDIEDITILKDAGSTAIYGSNGANGVVIITTKKGRSGTPKITLNAQYGIANAWKEMDMMNASQYFDLLTDFAASAKSNVLPTRFTGPDADKSKLDNTVWNDLIFHKGNIYDANVSISGGNDKSTYHFFSGYVDQEAITGSSRLKRWTNRIVLTQTAGRFSFGESILARQDWGSGLTVPLREYLYYPNYQPIKDAAIPGGYSALSSAADYTSVGNPLAALELRSASSRSLVLLPQLYAEVRLLPGLRFRSQFNAQLIYAKSEYFQKPYKNGNNIDVAREGGASVSEGGKYTIENYFSYNKTIAGVHSLSLTAGNSYINQGRGTSENVRGTGYLNDNITNAYVAPTKTVDASTYVIGAALISYFGRVNYVYDEKYIVSASLRRDGASNLDPRRRWANFPAAQVAWRFSEENFLKRFTFLSDGRVKASWGRTGNNAVPQTTGIVTVWNGANPTGSLSYPFGNTEDPNNGSAATIRNIVGPVVWETTDQTDIGLDLAFLENKLTVTVDWYRKFSKGLLTTVLFPNSGITGNGAQADMLYNAGDVLNTGLEAMIGYRTNISKNVSFNVSVNGSFNKNEVKRISLGKGAQDQIIRAGSYWHGEYTPLGAVTMSRVGDPIASFYGYQIDGVISSAAELAALNAKSPTGVYYNSATKPGDLKFRDVNGNGYISDSDKVILGNASPKFIYGINAGLNVGGFDVNMVWSGVAGVKLFRSGKIFMNALQSSMHNASTDLLDRWRKDGDIAANPRVGQNSTANLQPSAWYVEDGSYLRLRNLTIGYTVPLQQLGNLNKTVKSVRFFAAGQNLLTITPYKGYDPEVGNPDGNPADILSRGVDAGVSMPLPRTFLFGLQVGF
ncbi:SusC/RagA family TonB-linked outer membrane protein [Paraflavitalea pollutisoli]|uniref:SusC/RagA family TonB-linked outer membrane protein n=1 Tax=Paraflavitalea pollutisoli TaxID=3034143 RepID=UPI0023EBBD13|nr:SusC/RagA family TonB-linked outer membrane protein [Paraflavitalea sp. H1-2-19X]